MVVFLLDRETPNMHNGNEVIEVAGRRLFVTCMKVRDVIKLLEADGWYQVSMKGDHRQFKHPVKRGRVTVAGHLSIDVPPGTLSNIFKQAQFKRRR